MIKKVVKKGNCEDGTHKETDLAYWLTKSPQERIETVEILRRQWDGSATRLQRIARVIQHTQR